MPGWDHPDTARYYEAFCEVHDRYRAANCELIAHASLNGCERLLDLAAGTGRTAEVALGFLNQSARVVCYEPSEAMQTAGRKRLNDPRISWTRSAPDACAAFDRILCGAAIWQLLPLADAFERMASMLAPEGRLVFNVPSQYLGEPDQPGGGADPLLCELPALIAEGRVPNATAVDPISARTIEDALADAGFKWERWRHRSRLTQAALRDWMKIPVLTEALLGDLDADARAARIDAAFEKVDPDSWRSEEWSGWTAWLKLP